MPVLLGEYNLFLFFAVYICVCIKHFTVTIFCVFECTSLLIDINIIFEYPKSGEKKIKFLCKTVYVQWK